MIWNLEVPSNKIPIITKGKRVTIWQTTLGDETVNNFLNTINNGTNGNSKPLDAQQAMKRMQHHFCDIPVKEAVLNLVITQTKLEKADHNYKNTDPVTLKELFQTERDE